MIEAIGTLLAKSTEVPISQESTIQFKCSSGALSPSKYANNGAKDGHSKGVATVSRANVARFSSSDVSLLLQYPWASLLWPRARDKGAMLGDGSRSLRRD